MKWKLIAYRRDGIMHLRVALDVGDRPLHLDLDEHGDMLLFDAPILLNFPKEVGYFVLKDLCGDITCLTF